MIDAFPFEKRDSYPHMSAADTLIWNRFIDAYPDAAISCQYDFHIGDAPAFDTLMDDGTDLNQDKLYRLRIDVVAKTKTSKIVIEIKPRAGVSALGQVEKYAKLYKRDELPSLPVEMAIITDQEMPNMAYLCKDAGVKLIIV